MSKIKLIACDLDGTLLNSKGYVSEENLKAIEELSKRGIYFVPASGRAFDELPEQIAAAPFINYYVLSGGTCIYTKSTDECHSFSMPRSTVREMFDICSEYHFCPVLHSGKHCIFDAKRMRKNNLLYVGHFEELFSRESYVWVEDMDELLDRASIDYASFCFESDEAMLACYEKAKSVKGVSIVKNTMGECFHNIEFGRLDSDKGSTTLSLATRLGISEVEVAVIGDSENDLPMLTRFENSFAMANASERIKSISRYVACSNDEHIVKYMLENVL